MSDATHVDAARNRACLRGLCDAADLLRNNPPGTVEHQTGLLLELVLDLADDSLVTGSGEPMLDAAAYMGELVLCGSVAPAVGRGLLPLADLTDCAN